MKFTAIFTIGFCLLSLFSCRSRITETVGQDGGQVVAVEPADKASRVNVYIENSGSMNGYVNGATEFKTAMADLLVMLEYHYSKDSVFLYFINTGVYSIARPASSTTFAGQLNANNFRVGDVGSTNLNDIFKLILSKTEPETISVLLSDCIYSAKGNNTTDLLGIAKASTKSEFLQKSKASPIGYTTTIVKLSSDFNGTYFDRHDTAHQHSGKRPYYLCVIGTAGAMRDFNSVVPLKKNKLTGFDDSYTLSDTTFYAPFWSVLPAAYPARFIPIKDKSTTQYIRGIEDIEIDARNGGVLELGVAVDMSGYAVDSNYLLSPANYEVTKGDFSVTQITPISQYTLMPNDKIYAAAATHIIFVEANGNAYSDIEIKFKNQIPQWVYQTSVEEDANGIADDQTFGFKYMVEGIAEAYATRNNNDNYFTISIPIQQSGGMSLLGILGMLAGIGALAYLGVLIYKRNH